MLILVCIIVVICCYPSLLLSLFCNLSSTDLTLSVTYLVLNGGFGDFCEDPETIGLEVACWLQDAQLIDEMSKKAMKVGHPHAAEEIAMDIGNTTHEWMDRNDGVK